MTRYDLDHPEFKKLVNIIDDVNEKFKGGTLGDMCPPLAFIPTPLSKLVRKFFQIFISYLGNELEEHKENYDKGIHVYNTIA